MSFAENGLGVAEDRGDLQSRDSGGTREAGCSARPISSFDCRRGSSNARSAWCPEPLHIATVLLYR
jgi:hypothetical protein